LPIETCGRRFAPLAGFEVKHTRVEGQVLVVVVGLSVNLTAQTIEHVIQKRRKLVSDMCDQLVVSSKHHAAVAPEWARLRSVSEVNAIDVADRFLRSMRPAISGRAPEFYNVNSNLLVAIDEAVGAADAVDWWSEGVDELLDTWSAMEREQKSVPMLLAAQSLDISRRNLELTAAYGVAATICMSDRLTDLILQDNPLTDAGVAAIGTALAAKPLPVLSALTLGNTGAGERAARVFAGLIESQPSLTKLNLTRNATLDQASKTMLERANKERTKAGMPKLMLVL